MGRGPISTVTNLAVWLTGILVSLAVGFAMIDGILPLPIWLGGTIAAQAAGWIVVILTLVSVVLAIINQAS